jgi:phosphopantetheinyl transferase
LAGIALDWDGCLGVDVECLDEDHDGLAEGGFTDEERHVLAIPGAVQREWILRAWCGKEAVAKSLGTGFQGQPWRFALDAIGPQPGWLTYRCEGRTWRAFSSVWRDLCFALVLTPSPEGMP